MDKERNRKQRDFMKAYASKEVDRTQTDEAHGVEEPAPEVRMPKGSIRYFLEPIEDLADTFVQSDIVQIIAARKTRRKYTGEKLSFSQLSGLLWATAGYRKPIKKQMRHTPTAGNRQPYETYAIVMDSDEIPPGVYRYIPSQHALDLIRDNDHELRERADAATGNKSFVGQSGVTFVFAAVPYRTEWRYDFSSHRIMLMDVGHMCQNMYLAAEAMGLGACSIASYEQDQVDRLIGVDGVEQFAVYLCSVGIVADET